MKKLLYTILFCLIASTVFATDLYVSQSSSGNGSGSDRSNYMSVATFNSTFTGDKSDYFVYFDETSPITSRVINHAYGTSGHPLTLDGYESGSCDPTISVCSSSALLQQGMTIGDYTGSAADTDYVSIYDFTKMEWGEGMRGHSIRITNP